MDDPQPGRARSANPALAAFALVVQLVIASCGAAQRGPDAPSVGDRSAITREELAQVPGTNLYDILQRARPLWLITSGARTRSVNVSMETAVLTDGSYFGPIDTLRQLPVAGVRVVRYMTGSEAANTYAGALSGRHVEAVIVVEYGNEQEPDRRP